MVSGRPRQRQTHVGSDWRQFAACAQYPYLWWEAQAGDEARMAKRICWEQCPVRRECLAFALDFEGGANGRSGIWGGFSGWARTQIARGRLRDDLPLADSRDEALRRAQAKADREERREGRAGQQ